jgi:hypothetical protein
MRFAPAGGRSDRVETETGASSKPEDPQSTSEPAPEPAAAEATVEISGPKGSRQMMFVACGLIVSGALMIGVLNVRSAARAPTGAPVAAPVPAAGEPAPEKPLPPSAGWTENTNAWTAETRRRIAFELPSRNETMVWMKTVRPLLVVRCQEGQIEAFVYTDSAAAMEAQDQHHTVRVSFDGETGRTERWPDSSTHDALFAPDGAVFAARIMKAEALRFGYTPHNAPAVVAHFDVRGLREKLSPASACKSK